MFLKTVSPGVPEPVEVFLVVVDTDPYVSGVRIGSSAPARVEGMAVEEDMASTCRPRMKILSATDQRPV